MQNFAILNLPGPAFLNVFGAVVIAVLAGAWIAIRFADKTGRRPPPPVPQRPDAVQVAYLQGGVNQIIRMLVYDLVQRGYAKLSKDDRVLPASEAAPGALSPIERRVLDSIEARPLAHEIFADSALRSAIMNLLEPVRRTLAAEELIKPESVIRWRTRAQILGTLILLGLSGAKIYVARTTGHTNVSYLVFLTIASIAALFALAYVTTRAHASRRGIAWLENMRLAYKSRLEDQLLEVGAPTATKAFEGASLFLIGLYGFTVLKGTSDVMFYETFKRGSGSDGSSCGSSCGGSCGSGDGGGCGGCGGGGD